MKKRVLLVAVLALAVAAAGCGSKPAKEASKAVSGAVKEASEAVSEAVKDASEAVSEAVKGASEAVEEVKSEAGELASEVEEAVSGAISDASEAVEEVKSEAEELVSEVEEAVSGAIDEASEAVDEALSEAGELASEIEEEVSGAIDEASEAVEEGLSEAQELESEIEEEVSEAVSEAEELESQIEEELSSEEALEPVEVDYKGFVEAELDTPVIVETYVQATQSWWEDQINVYAQSEDGAYFLYKMACSKEDAEKLVPGTKIRVTGWKTEWSGEVEIGDATFEFIEDAEPFEAEAVDVTELLGKEELADELNKKVSFTGLKVEEIEDEDGNKAAFLYGNGSGSHDENSDLYFNVSVDGQTYTFCVESYLCNNETDVYKAVEELKVGDTIDAEGFLYWYNGPNPHITSITVK